MIYPLNGILGLKIISSVRLEGFCSMIAKFGGFPQGWFYINFRPSTEAG